MNASLSLRARLTMVILIPLLLISVLIGIWAFNDAEARASERFDRSLLVTALAISRDTAVTGGDALSEETRDLLRDTSGGAVFYHVYAPDGVFVTGYATPPVPLRTAGPQETQIYFDATYQRQPVRALRFTQIMAADGITGPFTFTVWQNRSVLDGFLSGRTRPTFAIIAALVSALALLVWFGVRLGLTPLVDLENAIERRSADDLSPIRRQIPIEVGGIVGRLNTLLDELRRTIDAKDVFISDAAHQLRNPIAGVLSLAEAVEAAPTLQDAKTRSGDLVEAARQTATLANNLLALERARAAKLGEAPQTFDLTAVLQGTSTEFTRRATQAGIAFTTTMPSHHAKVAGDPVMLSQAVLNLLNNALVHGGPTLSRIALTLDVTAGEVAVTVTDDGKGIDQEDLSLALGRFSQVSPSEGSGLGLPIAQTVVEAFGGQLRFATSLGQFAVTLILPEHAN